MSIRQAPLCTFSGCKALALFSLLAFSTGIARAQTTSAAIPVITPASGEYTSAPTVTITDSTPGATIFYRVIQTPALPRSSQTPDFTPYTGPFTIGIAPGAGVEAYATAPGLRQSNNADAGYSLYFPHAAVPDISLSAGTYSGPQVITLSDTTPGASIYYTLDGTSAYLNPNRLLYTGPITINGDAVLTTIATADNFRSSGETSAQYLISGTNSPFIYTIAGNGYPGFSGDGGPATLAKVGNVSAIATTASGDVFIATGGAIRKIAAGTGVITTIAGSNTSGYSGDGGPATQATLGYTVGLAVDGAGNLYLADSSVNVVRRISADTGIISTIAGTGINQFRYAGDGGPATAASLYMLQALASDPSGNLYIGDGTCAVRKITAATGIISTIIGNEYCDTSGDGQPAAHASIGTPQGIAVDASGNLFISTRDGSPGGPVGLIRKIDAASGIISTVAGVPPGTTPALGNPNLAVNTPLTLTLSIAVDPQDNLYFQEYGAELIRKVDSKTGLISNFTSGVYDICYSFGGDAGPAADTTTCQASALASDSSGDLLIGEGGLVREVVNAAEQPTVAAPAPVFSLSPGTYNTPQTLTITGATPGTALYVTLDGSTPTTISSYYNGPISITGDITVKAVAAAPGFLVSPAAAATYQITSPPPLVVNTVAGQASDDPLQTEVPATATSLDTDSDMSIATDAAGEVFFTESGTSSVYKIDAKGLLARAAGNMAATSAGDGGPATQASLYSPQALAIDSAGNLFIADLFPRVIRKVDHATGLISTFAGTPGPGPGGPNPPNGDGGPATAATFSTPSGLACDSAKNLFIADSSGQRIRRIDAQTGIITTVAGTGTVGYTPDGASASSANLFGPSKLAIAPNGDIYFVEYNGTVIRRIAASTGLLSTVVGANPGNDIGSDGGPAVSAAVHATDLAVDASGNVYITDSYSNTVRRIDATTGIITSIAGNGYIGFSGDSGAATMASFNYPSGLAFDSFGNLYVADSLNHRIRKLSVPVPAAAPTFSLAAGSYTGPQTVTIADTTAGAVIHYTTDGSVPTADSTTYSDPVTIASTTTLQAIAMAPGYLASAVTSAKYTIVVLLTPTVSVSPANVTIAPTQSLVLVVSVAGQAGSAAPTGTVSLAFGTSSLQAPLTSGAATFQLAAGSLPAGANALTATYSGDTAYASAKAVSQANVIQVTASLAGQPAPAPAGTAISTEITFAANATYNGTLALSCSMTAAPPKAQNQPTCALNPGTVTLSSGKGSPITATVTSSAPKAAHASNTGAPTRRGTGSTAVVFATLLLLILPKAKRFPYARLLLCFFLLSLSLTGCAGGNAQAPPQTPAVPGTTPGSYSFTVTGTDKANTNVSASTTFTVQID